MQRPPPPSPKWPPQSDPVLEARLLHHEDTLAHLVSHQCAPPPSPLPLPLSGKTLDQALPIARLLYLLAIGLLAAVGNISPEVLKGLLMAVSGKS